MFCFWELHFSLVHVWPYYYYYFLGEMRNVIRGSKFKLKEKLPVSTYGANTTYKHVWPMKYYITSNVPILIFYKRFIMLLRLFIVVGISWSYIAVQDLLRAGSINTKQSWGWQFFRCIYFLQGAFISVLILSNRRIIRDLAKKYPKLKGI